MAEQIVLVRDRKDGRIVRVRPSREPVKLRVCRACGRIAHVADTVCQAA